MLLALAEFDSLYMLLLMLLASAKYILLTKRMWVGGADDTIIHDIIAEKRG